MATAHAAALPFAALTAWRALHGLAAVAPGQTVLVHGAAGSVGSFATQYLRHHGCRVLATCRPTQIEQVRQDCGPDAAVMSVDDFLAATAEGSEAGEGGAGHDLGCDVVLDGLGKGVAEGELQRHSLRVLKPGGTHPSELSGSGSGIRLRLRFGLRLHRSSHFARLVDSSSKLLTHCHTPRTGHLCDLNGQLIRAVRNFDGNLGKFREI